MDTFINWNGLPCMTDSDTGKSAIFTNIEGILTICRVETSSLYKDTLVRQIREAGGFTCLDSNKEESSKEFTVVLSVTERCNARCRYCFLDARSEGNDMDRYLIEKAIDFAIRFSNGRIINFAVFGGEPSIRPDLVKYIVTYARKKYFDLGIGVDKLKFSITTNGYFSDDFCDFLIQNKFHISFSMDGIPLVQKMQRPSVKGIPQLEKNLSRLAKSDCHLKVRATVTEYSSQYMLETTQYLHNFGVKRIHFEPVTPGGRAEKVDCLTNQPNVLVFSKKLISCIQYGESNGMDIICFPYMNMNNSPKAFCDGSIKNRIVVGPRGILSTCVEVQNSDHPLYDYLGIGYFDKDEDRFIINNNERRACHNCMGDRKKNECKTCAFSFFCAGGCPTRNYRGTKDSQVISEFRCNITKHVMPFILRRFYDKTFNN